MFKFRLGAWRKGREELVGGAWCEEGRGWWEEPVVVGVVGGRSLAWGGEGWWAGRSVRRGVACGRSLAWGEGCTVEAGEGGGLLRQQMGCSD